MNVHLIFYEKEKGAEKEPVSAYLEKKCAESWVSDANRHLKRQYGVKHDAYSVYPKPLLLKDAPKKKKDLLSFFEKK